MKNTRKQFEALVDTPTAAKLLAISASSLSRYRASGEVRIPHVVIGKRLVRYRLSDLQRFAEENTVSGTLNR